MKKLPFSLGILLGLLIAWFIWPKPEIDIQDLRSDSKEQPRRSKRSISELLNSCRTATTQKKRHSAYLTLAKRAQRNYREALTLAGVDDDQNTLNQEVTVILLGWAGSDPRAALEWSWHHLRSSPRWELAMEEIMETWIASGDHTVFEFLENVIQQENPLTPEEAIKEQAFVLHREQMNKIKKWLYFYDSQMARTAWERGVEPLSQFPEVATFVDQIVTVEDIQHAIKVWTKEPIEQTILTKIHKRAQILKMVGILVPESSGQMKPPTLEITTTQKKPDNPTSKAFAKANAQSRFWTSAREDLATSLDQAATLNKAERQAAYLTMYDSWALFNPGKKPDYSSLPPEVQAVWRDLSIVGPVNDSLHFSTYSK